MNKLNSNTRLVRISTHNDVVSFLSNSMGSRSYWLYLSGVLYAELRGASGGSRGIVMNVNERFADMIILDHDSLYGRYDLSQSNFTYKFLYNMTTI